MAGVQLIVTPMSLSFQAPLDHPQKRLITLLNPSDEDVIFRINITNDKDYSVVPIRGRVKAFDTTELDVTLVPVIGDLPKCSLIVTSIPYAMLADKENVRWNSTDVQIELDPQKTPREGELLQMRLQGDDLAKVIKKQYPRCSCSKKIKPKPKTRRRRLLYILGILAVMVATYFVYLSGSFSLRTERIF